MLKVLIVDDEPLVRNGLRKSVDWNALGYEVCGTAENGQEGYEMAVKYRPDLIVSDIRMPYMTGLEMLKKLRAEGYDRVQVIFLTAYSEFQYAQEALKLLAADYLLKPFEDGQLEEAVRKVTLKFPEKAPEGIKLLPEVPRKANRYVREAAAYVAENYSDPNLAVSGIANYLGVSEGYLSRLFRKETGWTLASYITACRIENASAYLKDVRLKVYEVARKCGYLDVAYFSSIFKKQVGVSPSEYQASVQTGSPSGREREA